MENHRERLKKMSEEQLLQNIDFSRFSRIRASLWQSIQQKHQARKLADERELGWDELDQLVAARGFIRVPEENKDIH
jgi:hypothetical protein